MLVTLYKKDLVTHYHDDDIEKFMSAKEKKHFKRPSFLPGVRAQIFANFKEYFGLTLDDLIENYTFEGKKIETQFLPSWSRYFCFLRV